MTVLAIECSSQRGSVALLSDGVRLDMWEFLSPRGRGTELFARLESALRDCPRLNRVVVGTGPGSYNGMRMAIAAAWGIAKARGATLGGVSSLLGYEAGEYFVVGDARARQWFLARVKNGSFVIPPALFDPADALALLEPGVPVFSTSVLDAIPQAEVSPPRADLLARREFSPGLPVPFYLKPPHITKSAPDGNN